MSNVESDEINKKFIRYDKLYLALQRVCSEIKMGTDKEFYLHCKKKIKEILSGNYDESKIDKLIRQEEIF